MFENFIGFLPQLCAWTLGVALGYAFAYATIGAKKDEYAKRLAVYLRADVEKQRAIIHDCMKAKKQVPYDDETNRKWTELAIKHGIKLPDPDLGTVSRFN